VTFTHDVEHSLATIVDLVNTDPASAGEELLPDLAALREFVESQEVSEVGRLTLEDLAAVQAVRPRLRAVFLAADAADAARMVNDVVGAATVTPRLTDHDGYHWHIHYFAPGASLAEHLAVDGGMALAHVVVADEMDRLRVCDAPDCSRVLVDLSRNRSKRYCDSRTCGNRLHVAAYRERRRAAVAG
jgi:predicted RNA-binding Zn ribbon-like protein